MARKFYYYNVVITLNNTATTLYFSDFLQKVCNINWENRVRKIKEYPTSLFELVQASQDGTCQIAAIGKYRQTVKPYTGDLHTNIANMIQNDIIEMTTLVTIPMVRTVLVEFNMYGSKIKDIEDYFNSFFSTTDPSNQWKINFIAVNSERSLEDVRRSNDIKDVSLKMNVDNEDYDSLLRRSENPPQRNSLFSTVIRLSNEISTSTDAPVIDLKFGKGRKRKIELDSLEILNLIELLNINTNDSIISCIVNFKNLTIGKYEKLDLKNVGVKSDTVLEEDKGNHGWQFVGDKILEKYIEKGRLGSISSRGIVYHSENVTMPTLLVVATEEYSINIEEGSREDEPSSE